MFAEEKKSSASSKVRPFNIAVEMTSTIVDGDDPEKHFLVGKVLHDIAEHNLTAGDEIKISLRKDKVERKEGQKRREIADLSRKFGTANKVLEGAIVNFETVWKSNDGTFNAQWFKTLTDGPKYTAGSDSEKPQQKSLVNVLFMVTPPSKKGETGKPFQNAYQIATDKSKEVSSLDELKAMFKAYFVQETNTGVNKSAFIRLAGQEADSESVDFFGTYPINPRFEKNDSGDYEMLDGEKIFEYYTENRKDIQSVNKYLEKIDEIKASGGKIFIEFIPARSFSIGGKSIPSDFDKMNLSSQFKVSNEKYARGFSHANVALRNPAYEENSEFWVVSLVDKIDKSEFNVPIEKVVTPKLLEVFPGVDVQIQNELQAARDAAREANSNKNTSDNSNTNTSNNDDTSSNDDNDDFTPEPGNSGTW